MNKIRVGVIDDSVNFLHNFIIYMNSQADIEVVFAEQTGVDLLKHVHEFIPDILVLDLSLPEKNGAWLAQSLLHADIQVPILILSVFNYPRFARRVGRMKNISGYLIKNEPPDVVLAAIRRIAGGEREIYSDEIKNSARLDHHPDDPHDIGGDLLLGRPIY